MGDATLWLAFRGIERATVLERMNLQPATEPDPVIFGAGFSDGWYLMKSRHGLNFMNDKIMNEACSDCSAVSCYLESHMMISGASGWEEGRRIWSVTHDCEQGIDHLETEGGLPAAFTAIRDRLMAKQRSEGERPRVDYIYDVPIEIAAALTGFHHVRGTSAGYPDFEPLEVAVIPATPAEWWLEAPPVESWFEKY
jgi:hypothetical protein